MKLIVGLGNPGKEYVKTRHNVGFIVIDKYVRNSIWSEKKDFSIIDMTINNEKILCLKPLTYMNLSGRVVAQIANYYKIVPENILVIHDDLDLPIGKYRLKINSSSGGHNGIKDIELHLGTKSFARLKIGIGNNKFEKTKNYVLNNLSTTEIEFLESSKIADIINSFIVNGIEKTMNDFNNNGE